MVDDLVELFEDTLTPPAALPPWQVMVVDDDPEVHLATDLALRGTLVEGRALQLSHAHSAAEARQMLPQTRELAVILLDVVMETERAGLDLVDFIRSACGLLQTRIILRTGQPGYAPELGVVERYDINDYRTKAELTRSRLLTALQAAIRSYQQIRTLAEHRRGLELIVRGAHVLLRAPSLASFAALVLEQLAALTDQPINGLFCTDGEGEPVPRVLAACGALADQQGLALAALAPGPGNVSLQRAFSCRSHQFEEGLAVLFLDCGSHDAAVLLAASAPFEQQLLEVFAATLTGCYGTLRRFEEVNFVAYHDSLTGLANRAGFVRELDAARPDGSHAVALLDLRDFSALNDGLGHDVGNALLLAVARRLRDRFSPACVLARVGGDVFGLCGPREQLNIDALQRLFAEPFACGEHRLPAHVAIGMALASAEAGHGITTLSRAGIALNSAKHASHGQSAHFQPAMEERVRERLVLVNRLRNAIDGNALDVWFQPQLDLGSGRVVGIEALARWPMTDAPGGWCSPAVFVPLAESSGLIGAVGEFVLDRACAALAQLDGQGGVPLRIAVNVAMPQLRQKGFADGVHRTLQRHGVAPTRLEIEITESMALEDPRVVRDGLDALRVLGSRVAIDDFGTGYSSLAQVRDMPIDVLKLDRSFVQAVDQPQGAAFAETIVRMAQRLGLQTVAEGVETAEQAACLHALGCDTGQGYLFARPMPLDVLRDWLAQRDRSGH